MMAHARCGCLACTIEDALVLLSTRRPTMAQRLLEPLPAVIQAAVKTGRATEAEEAPRGAAGLASTRRQIRAAEMRLAELRAETQPLEAERRDLQDRIAHGRNELQSLAEAVTRKPRELARPRAARPAPKPSSRKPYQLLAAALKDGRPTAKRVAELLKLRPEDVAALAEGRVGLAASAWRRLELELTP